MSSRHTNNKVGAVIRKLALSRSQILYCNQHPDYLLYCIMTIESIKQNLKASLVKLNEIAEAVKLYQASLLLQENTPIVSIDTYPEDILHSDSSDDSGCCTVL